MCNYIPLQNLLRTYEIQRRRRQCPLSSLTKCIVNNELNADRRKSIRVLCTRRRSGNSRMDLRWLMLSLCWREKGFQNLFLVCVCTVSVCVSCYHRKWRCSRGRCRRATFTFSETAPGIHLQQTSWSVGISSSRRTSRIFLLQDKVFCCYFQIKTKFQRRIFMKIHRYIGHKIQRVTIFCVYQVQFLF